LKPKPVLTSSEFNGNFLLLIWRESTVQSGFEPRALSWCQPYQLKL
jgi:hypothetical protein